eukprot:2312550-Alexandrium_andersonii.AAC.1
MPPKTTMHPRQGRHAVAVEVAVHDEGPALHGELEAVAEPHADHLVAVHQGRLWLLLALVILGAQAHGRKLSLIHISEPTRLALI